MIRVLIDGRTVRENPSGVGYTVINIIKQLSRYKNIKLIVVTRKGINNIPNINNIIIHESDFHYQFAGVKRFLFEQLYLPLLIKKYQPHILHLTDSFGVPYIIPQDLKVIVTLHDLIPLTKYRELMGLSGFLSYKLSITHSLLRADRIICVSKFTEEDLHRFFPSISLHKTRVIYNGIEPPTYKDDKKLLKKIFNQYGIKDKYVLYLGGFPPRKNVLGLVKAFYRFNARFNETYQLILLGRFSPNLDIKKNIQLIRQFITAKKLENKVIVLDYLSTQEKNVLLKKAIFFSYLSFYEGFGLPVIEALISGTPVLTSKNSAMEEVAGKFALYSNPHDENDIIEKMTELINNYQIYKKRAEIAKIELIKKFNWEKSGRLYYREYKSLG